MMKTLLKLEEFALLLLSIFAFYFTSFDWWYYPAFFLLPDIGMIGYAINTKIGAITYNLFHHRFVSVLVYSIGFHHHNDWFMFAGIILFGHISFDRIMGYGLKYSDSFYNTHLGNLKK